LALPPNPTALDLIQEGMKKALGRVATSGEQVRALDTWTEEIKNEIWMYSSTHELLEGTKFQVASSGIQRISVPTDFDTLKNIEILDSDSRDTAQAGTSNTITLSASDSGPAESRTGKEIVLFSGTGSGQRKTIILYNDTTKIATVDSNWDAVPDSTTKYGLISAYIPIAIENEQTFNRYRDRTIPGRPQRAILYNGDIHLIPVPDQQYGMITHYWINIQKLDKAATAYTTMLRDWRLLFTQGYYSKTLQSEDDMRYIQELPVYNNMIALVTYKGNQMGQVEPHDF